MSTPPESALRTLRGVARAIGVDPGRLSKESKRPGFPAHRADDGAILYDANEVRTWRQANVRQRKEPQPAIAAALPAGQAGQLASPAPAPPAPPRQPRVAPARAVGPSPQPSPPRAERTEEEIGADADLLAVLQSGKASALEISRAAMQLASRRVARDHREDRLGPNALDGLKKSLQELRSAEADYITLEKQRRELIPRDEVKAIVTECCGRLVRVLGTIENTIATEFAIWLADPKVASMGADERNRMIRGFVQQATRAARNEEADAIDRLIHQRRDDDGAPAGGE